MPPINPKNFAIPGASNDLGLGIGEGDQLQNQLQDEIAQRKKAKMIGDNTPQQGIYGASTGSASASLGILSQSQGGLG